jgi:hypothetical protein
MLAAPTPSCAVQMPCSLWDDPENLSQGARPSSKVERPRCLLGGGAVLLIPDSQGSILMRWQRSQTTLLLSIRTEGLTHGLGTKTSQQPDGSQVGNKGYQSQSAAEYAGNRELAEFLLALAKEEQAKRLPTLDSQSRLARFGSCIIPLGGHRLKRH